MNDKTRLVIADSHMLFAEACKHLLSSEFDVVSVVTDGRSLLTVALKLKPAGIVLDISLPRLNGLDAADQIKRKLPTLKLLFLAATFDADAAAEAFRRGASGYVLKQSGSEEFITAVRTVMRGQSYLSSLIARETIRYLLRHPKDSLKKRITRKQSEILQLLIEGRSMKEVAGILDLSPGTIAFHKYNMMGKLGIATNAELLQYGMRNHMAPIQGSSAISHYGYASPVEMVGEQRRLA
jgi:DNA-binding NarL/FixJ family response regulator